MNNTNSQARKWQITINNNNDKGFDKDSVIKLLTKLKGAEYFCLSEEVGGEKHTPHMHLFVIYTNPKLFSTICKLFDGQAHIEIARGSNIQNKDYVNKSGKWENSEKSTTSIPGTQYEWGELPPERSCPKPELQLLYELINEGKTDAEILAEYPEYMFDITHIDRTRLIIKEAQFSEKWRNIECTYIFGVTGIGKSRSVMEKYGYSNVYRVTDYQHPYDTYTAQEILMFEEFSSSIRIQDILNYLDGYPLVLPARYSQKVACFTKVYFSTNIALEKQYPNVQAETPRIWEAFLRRITNVIWYKSKKERLKFDSVDAYFEYINTHKSANVNTTTLKEEYQQLGFKSIPNSEKIPFE